MDNSQLRKKSRQGAGISAIGFLIMIFVFVFAAFKLNTLNNDILEKTQEKIDLDSTITKQRSDIQNLKDEINNLKDPSLKPQAYAVLLPNIKDHVTKNQVYDFNLWITSSQFTLNKIKKVEYTFKHKTMLLKKRDSKNKSNSFLVSYRGWGCLKFVIIKVTYIDNTTETINFDMCSALGW
ncbi:MAG: hypothetical protein ACI9SI_001120 [Polaribacter sp.]|jgi:hypothetical protein